MSTTFDVRIWKLREKVGRRGRKSYTVRWTVAGREWSKSYATKALAESFRAKLVTAQKEEEAFRAVDGLPVSAGREVDERSWFAFAQQYVDMK
ncbi:hypothetical protein SAMN05421810_11236 [Amycolatopsis arida]|uniref:Uncharacterized protein n=1 Tax=Amycolatopsis arida TaxID=587909 RepID=A0A1I6ADZ0_9PSEU|nr:hypothetical protein [Amycolatopsis arida]TDX97658.1 hypothetical protein CLV69_102762 [Amycolatopsis arida]SFQ66833.1 hypothetical protein SAMN05421810_11236 [Amycolatopsis arida]